MTCRLTTHRKYQGESSTTSAKTGPVSRPQSRQPSSPAPPTTWNCRSIQLAAPGSGSEPSVDPIVENGKVVRVRGAIQDITDRRRAEAEIRQLNAELEQRVRDRTAELEATNKELEAFSYSVSHDLRAPLRAINGFSQIVLDDYGPQLPEDARSLPNDICDGARRWAVGGRPAGLSRLGRHSVRRESIDTADLVAGCLRDVLRSSEPRRIEVRVGDLPACEADPALLRQVWLNLLSNAVKYSGPRDPAMIEVGAAVGPDGPTYYVRDNGVGFDMRYANKLFGVFQRLHRAEEFEGTGIGLALVQRIVHRHGGRVWAEAEPDKGATFYFTSAAAGDWAECAAVAHPVCGTVSSSTPFNFRPSALASKQGSRAAARNVRSSRLLNIKMRSDATAAVSSGPPCRG